MNITEEDLNDEIFNDYLEKYCTKHKLSKEEACKHKLVKIQAAIYREERHHE